MSFLLKDRINALLFAALLLSLFVRLLMVSASPYLNEWDERFHAMVAKNMMTHPFKPMLRVEPVLSYDYTAWCCNHVWLHKQPLFLWQMALSMKIFGANLLAMRLPSVIMGTLLVFPVYRIGAINFNGKTGLFAALLVSVAYYQLEIISGTFGMDHNDMAFLFYVTVSIWAFYEYTRAQKIKWAVLAGGGAGMAILCKWLTGLLVYAGWSVWIFMDADKVRMLRTWLHFLAALVTTVLVALPWQLYTALRFPAESQYERAFNTKHIWEVVEGHSGGWDYYFDKFDLHYGHGMCLIASLAVLWGLFEGKKRGRFILFLFIALPYVFFSFIAKTKLPNYVYFVSPLMYVFMGYGLSEMIDKSRNGLFKWCVFGLFVFWTLRPTELWEYHAGSGKTDFISIDNKNAKIHNTDIYEQLNELVPEGYVVFNCKSFEDVEAMFFSDRNVYSWWMNEQEYLDLKQRGIKVAVFKNHTNQQLPHYLTSDKDVLVIDKELK